MTQEELKARYEYNREKLHTTKEHVYMVGAEKYMDKLTHFLIDAKPAIVAEAMEVWDGMLINNFITENEAMDAVAKLENITGEVSPKWKPTILFSTIESLGVPMHDDKLYNKWAIFYTMNWLYSDYAEELGDVVDGDPTKLATLIYKMSCKKLNDPDNLRWIRKHIGLE